jgi:MFS family permease
VRLALPRSVIVLGLVSLANDAASEMVTPLLPVFLTAVLGAGPAVVGLVEGLAESTASVLKLVSGRLVDRGAPAKGLVVGGYALSNAARPLVALAAGWPVVMALRFADRVGKGLRTAPRDAVLAAAVAASDRGRAFGFHRAMDHLGAVVGPALAWLLLAAGVPLREVFLASALPGAVAVLLLVAALPAPPRRPLPAAGDPPAPGWRALDARLRGLVVAAGALALTSLPEAFLVLWTQTRGLDVAALPLLWAAAHVVKALVAAPAGALSDRVGRVPVVAAGWAARVAVLVALASPVSGAPAVWALFLAWAAVVAATEGAERALIGDAAPEASRATLFGVYHLVAGLLALPGGVLFGTLWQAFGAPAAFGAAALGSGLSATALLALARGGREPSAGVS